MRKRTDFGSFPAPIEMKFLIHVVLRNGDIHICYTISANPSGTMTCLLKEGGIAMVEPAELWDIRYLPME